MNNLQEKLMIVEERYYLITGKMLTESQCETARMLLEDKYLPGVVAKKLAGI